ncbi:MAG: HEAT repeat domain-containing protein [Deltaproteobacteria bacterium]|nr:HEAT repeat domain-containing protein [Deltaproteobacteria bacterium]
MRKPWRMFFVVLALLVPAGAAADEPAALSDAAMERLSGLLHAYEHQPTAGEFEALGERDLVRDALIRIVGDDAEVALLRGRAIVALGYFPDETSRRAIEGVLDRPELSDIILRRAIETMAHAYREAGLSRISPYLDDARSDVREAAAVALGEIGTAAALRALRRRLAREETAVVRTTIEREVRRLEEAAAAE